MLAKINVPANAEVELVAATTGAARLDGKEKWDPESRASFHMSHTLAGMTAYEKVPPGTTAEVADGTILPIDGFGTVEVDLDQSSATTKPVRGFPSGMCQDVHGTCRPPVKQWINGVNSSSTTKRRPFWGSRWRNRLFLISAPAGDCFPQQV